MSMNTCTLVGNLGGPVDLRFIGTDSRAVANFSLATSKKWKNKTGQSVEKVQWHRVQVWGKQAEACAENLVKGSQVLVTGEINYRSYEKDGAKHYVTEIVASSVQFLNTRKNSDKNKTQSDSDGDGIALGDMPQDDQLVDTDIPY